MELFTFTSSYDDIDISCMLSIPVQEPVGIIQFIHGMAEHKERYISMMSFFTDHGYVCAINDHLGHGKSLRNESDRGYMYSGGASALIEDTYHLSLLLLQKFSGKPLFLYGHSMGSMIARCYLRRHDDISMLSGVILSGSPSYNPASGIGLMLTKVIGYFKGEYHRSPLLQKMSFGSYNKNIPNAISANSWLTTDSTIVDEYDKSPDCGYIFTINGFKALLGVMKECYSPIGWLCCKPELPILFVSGSEDPCHGGERFLLQSIKSLQKVGYQKVSYHLFQGMRHEIHNEPRKQEVYNAILQFITA